MNKFDYLRLYFDDPETDPEATGYEAYENTTTSSDLEPAISIDHVNRLVDNIDTLRKALGITNMKPMASGSVIKRYKTTVTKGAKQAAEGEIIPLSKVERKPLDPLTLELNPYRKLTTAQAIQKVGRAIALNETDEALEREIAKDVRNEFFTLITANTATDAGNGATLQAAAANVWGKLSVYFEDKEVSPVYFVNPLDVAAYLGTAAISTQEAFGFRYVENFLGLGTAFVTPRVAQGKVYATVEENLNGAYVPQSGDVADSFDLTFDESGMIGMTHSRADDRASIQTLIMSGVLFYPEDASGVIYSNIGA